MYELGFIGTGNMGGALARAAVQSVDPSCIILSNRTPEKARALAQSLGCACGTNAEAAQARFVVLGVKPQMLGGVLAELAGPLAARAEKPILVSMAAGVSMADVRRMAGGDYPVIRLMPNTPVEIGQGLVLWDATDDVDAASLDAFLKAMRGAGRFERLEERLIDAGSAVGGCGPAFAFLFIEALADGGVACGLPRDKAMAFAAQMLVGSAALALESGRHPGALKDAVCSPGGSTIAGVRALEEKGFRAACMDAVIAAFDRTKALGK